MLQIEDIDLSLGLNDAKVFVIIKFIMSKCFSSQINNISYPCFSSTPLIEPS